MTSNENFLDAHRSDDDGHDHIGSQSATPSGARTPRPDLQDKRLPGIMHAYFGQVGNESASVSQDSPSTSDTIAKAADEANPSRHIQSSAQAPLTAPSTPLEGDANNSVNLQAEQSDSQSSNLDPSSANKFGYPTPPVSSPSSSSSSSIKQKELESSERPGNNSNNNNNNEQKQASEGSKVSSRRNSRSKASARLSISSLQPGAGLKSLPGIVTSFSVQASHISSRPTSTRNSTASNSPTHPQSPLSALSSCLDLVRLTRGVAPPRKKNTPPHTPRANSTSGGEGGQKSSAPSSSSSTHGNETSSLRYEETRASDSYIELPPTRKPKGKLSMNISEGRGLKPSHDPYVVCFFEWNEYITRGPKQVEEEVERSQSRTREQLLGGVPIQRSGSDMGRPIAIPMKSRQGSSTSMTDHRNGAVRGKQVTDPKWDIEATL
jgi:serine/threonine protein kinase SCH9